MRPHERMSLFGRGADARIVTHEHLVAASPAEVWDLIADPNRIGLWWPRATGGEVIEGEGAGRRQRLLMDWGRQTGMIEQTVTQWDRPRAYGWRVTKETSTTKGLMPPLADVQVTIGILPRGAGSLVQITGEYRPAGVGRIPALRQMGRQAKATYRTALRRLEAVLLTGR